MMFQKNKICMSFLFVLSVVGLYNSIVMESVSDIKSEKYTFIKRLDHEGINRPARQVASIVKWRKLDPVRAQKQVAVLRVDSTPKAVESNLSSISEDLNLSLVEVINPEKFKDGLLPSDFSGSLTTNGSQIETLEISLPQGLGISVSYSELTGNVFEYESNGEVFSGLIYQVDQNAYMVSFTAGELAGTRLRFQGTLDPVEQEIAETDVGQFGQDGFDADLKNEESNVADNSVEDSQKNEISMSVEEQASLAELDAQMQKESSELIEDV